MKNGVKEELEKNEGKKYFEEGRVRQKMSRKRALRESRSPGA
jgi:hypothetical protein